MFRVMLLCAALWSIGSAAAASGSSPGLVTRIHILNGGIVMFYQTSARSTTPACHTMTHRWAFNGATAAGQAKLSALLSAYAMKKPLTVIGFDNCADWGDTESVDYFVIEE